MLTNLRQLGSPERLPDGKPGLALRMGVKKAGPVVSDNGNFIIDAPFPRHEMEKPVDVSTFLMCWQVRCGGRSLSRCGIE